MLAVHSHGRRPHEAAVDPDRFVPSAPRCPRSLPSGYFVASTMSTSLSNPGGLWLVHPTIPGPAAPITGLSSELTARQPARREHRRQLRLLQPGGRHAAGRRETGSPEKRSTSTRSTSRVARVVLDIKTPVGVGTTSNSSIMQISPLANGRRDLHGDQPGHRPTAERFELRLLRSRPQYRDAASRCRRGVSSTAWSVDEAAGVIYFAQWQPSELWSVSDRRRHADADHADQHIDVQPRTSTRTATS